MQSPGYPRPEQNYTETSHTVTGRIGTKILVEILDINLGDSQWMSVEDGNGKVLFYSSDLPLDRSVFPKIISDTEQVIIKYVKTIEGSSGKGFLLTCTKDIIENSWNSVKLSDPRYMVANASVMLIAPQGHTIHMKIQEDSMFNSRLHDVVVRESFDGPNIGMWCCISKSKSRMVYVFQGFEYMLWKTVPNVESVTTIEGGHSNVTTIEGGYSNGTHEFYYNHTRIDGIYSHLPNDEMDDIHSNLDDIDGIHSNLN